MKEAPGIRVRGFDLCAGYSSDRPTWPLVAADRLSTTRLRAVSQLWRQQQATTVSPSTKRRGGFTMQISRFVSHAVIGCVGALAGYLVSVGQVGIPVTYAQAPATSPGMKTTELFNQVMEDVLGRRLTVRLTEREPGNGSPAHRHPGS